MSTEHVCAFCWLVSWIMSE